MSIGNAMTFDVEIKNLTKSFRDVKAVNGLNLTVNAGETLGLIGPDGAGKTTTLRILCGLLTPDNGECYIKGKNVVTQLQAIHDFIGYMPQRFSLYPDLTVAENMYFFARLFNVGKVKRQERLQRLLQFSKLGPFSDRRAADLSGGMKQKLALSCTLIHTPQVLFLDEPTTGVDPVSRREFWDILAELKSQHVTILVTTPYMDEAAKCDRIAFIHQGKILAIGTPDEISELYRGELVELQCDSPVEVAALLREIPDVRSVHILGNRIHISGGDRHLLMKWIHNTLHQNNIRQFSLSPVSASIEDVFVQLMHQGR